MIKALKVTMIVYAALGILVGLAYVFVPRQFGATYGYEYSTHEAALAAALGVSFISGCIFLIIAARDPLKHILWVKYVIVFTILMSAAHIYSFILGYIIFSHAIMDTIIQAVFAAALLAFYPWRAARSGE